MNFSSTVVQELKYLLKFSGVGIFCTLIHAIIFTLVYEFFSLSTVICNLIAFCTAFFASYFGHTRFTFARQFQYSHGLRAKFFITTFSGLILNIFWGILFIDLLNWNILIYDTLGLFVLTPIITYLLYRLWVFSQVKNLKP